MKKLLFVSLGCDKNLVDSERMIHTLCECGYELTDDEECAEVIVINTCCFIHDAKEESVENILEMSRLKENGNCKVSYRPLATISSAIPILCAVMPI